MRTLIITLLAICMLALAACGATNDDTITIGGVYTLSGELVPVLHGSAEGARMAVADFERETGRHVRLIEEDDKSCAEKTAGANKLVNLDGVRAIVGTTCSSMTLAIAPITEANKVLLVSGTSTSVAVTGAGDYIFRTIPADDSKAAKVAQEIAANGLTRVAIVYASDNDYSLTAVADIKKALPAGTSVVAEQTVLVNTQDFRTVLLKVKEARPDVLVLSFSNSVQFAEILKQRDELGMERIPVYTPSETVENPDVITAGGAAVEGILFPAFAAPSGPATDAFAAAYAAQYGEAVPAYAAETYDGTMIALKALAASTTPEEARAKMFEFGDGYEGASGTIAFDEHGDVHKPLVMKTIRDGKFVPA